MKKLTKDQAKAVTALALTQVATRLFVLTCKMNISVDTIIRDCYIDNKIDYDKFYELVNMYYTDYIGGAE